LVAGECILDAAISCKTFLAMSTKRSEAATFHQLQKRKLSLPNQ